MKVITEELKFAELFPEQAGKLAQKLHIKKEDIPFVRKSYISEKDKTEVNKKERAVVSYISTSTRDRDGDELMPDGVELANYRKNPIVLWSHDYRSVPIGKNIWIKKDDKGLIAKTVFAKNDKADELFGAYSEDLEGTGPLLAGWSVGFIPIESEDIEVKDKSKDKPGKRFTKWELLEYSAVPIPSCPEALTIAQEKGLIPDGLKKDLEIELEVDDLQEDDDIEITIEEDEDPQYFTTDEGIVIEGDHEKEAVTKPETTDSYHRIPVSSGHNDHKIRTISISAKEGIKALYCVDCKKVKTYLFDVNKWTMEEAKKWVADHKDFTDALEAQFEVGEKEIENDELIEEMALETEEKEITIEEEHKQEEFSCECIECGHKMISEKHCKDLKCPECGGKMRRAERPGPGQEAIGSADYKELQSMFKSIQDTVAELKEGRVLSTKNRTLVKEVMDAIGELRDRLEALYTATEPPDKEEQEREFEIERDAETKEAKDESLDLNDPKVKETIDRVIADKIALELKRLKGEVE